MAVMAVMAVMGAGAVAAEQLLGATQAPPMPLQAVQQLAIAFFHGSRPVEHDDIETPEL